MVRSWYSATFTANSLSCHAKTG